LSAVPPEPPPGGVPETLVSQPWIVWSATLSATLRDVAQHAGVSMKTASRVVNRQGEVSPETRRRVLEAIEATSYRPSKLARGLVTRRTDTIGLVLGDISNPFFPEVARGVLDDAEQAGYNVFVCNTDGELQREIRVLQSLADHAVDGVIIFPSFEVEEFLRTFAGQGRPVVCVNRPFESEWMSRVMIESRTGARLAVEHLIGRGHRNIGMLTGQASPPQRHERVQGYLETLQAHELPADESWIISGPPVFEQGRTGAHALLAQRPDMTALFTYNDVLALGALRALGEMGRRAPDDCAVVGFDDIPMAGQVAPPLTTVRVDKYALGQQCMGRMCEMLSRPGSIFPPASVGVELVVRRSA
jgi:LacI family transcriptional regulator